MTLTTRRPTGKVPYPFILIEGEEKAGKSWKGAEFSASTKIGRFLWLDLGEGAGDEYDAIPGANYELILHDGSYRSIYQQVCDAHAEAARAAEAGEPPVVLWFDNGTQLWDLLKSWIDSRARKRKSNEAKLAKDPDVEIDITSDLWNDATERWRAVITKMMTFPGIAVMVARGKETIAMDANGRPIPKQKDYRVEGQKNLAFDASVWLRMTREQGSFIVGARSVHAGVRPGKNARPHQMPDDWSLEHLVFEVLKCEPGSTHVRDLKPTGAAIEAKSDTELAKAKSKVWTLAQKLGWDAESLAKDYAKTTHSAIADATPDQLDEYSVELIRELETLTAKAATADAAAVPVQRAETPAPAKAPAAGSAPMEQQTRTLVETLLTVDTPGRADKGLGVVQESPVKDTKVAHLLGQQELDALAVTDMPDLTLVQLAHRVGVHVRKHKRPVRPAADAR